MTKWRKVALGCTAAAILVAIAASLALHALVDPERLKRVARDKAQAAWSRELSVAAVSLQLWPLPALHAEKIALANPAWAKAPQLFQAESVDARLAILPLLIGRVRVKGLELDGVKLNLETGADGARSWDLAAARAGARDKPVASSDSDFLDLTGLTIRNADVNRRVKGVAAPLLRIDEASAEASPGLRDVRIDASVSRNRRPLTLKAFFADLSRVGVERATTDGKIDLDWGKTHLTIAGRMPLEAGLKGYAMNVDLKASSLQDMLGFFGDNRLPTAASSAHFGARESLGRTEVTGVTVAFGKHRLAGSGVATLSGDKWVFNARLDVPRLDWPNALLELGFPPLPPLAADELFHDNDLAWPLLMSAGGTEGIVDIRLGSLLLRNGVEMKNVKARAALAGDRLSVSPYSIETLGGSATGSLLFEGRKKTVRVTFEGTNLLLERWFHERGHNIPFTGGPMNIKATLTTLGDSMKDLAASITGPVSIRMGPGVWASEKAGHAEDVMVSAFSSRNSASIDFECMGAALPFVAGRASAKTLVGARSKVSNLLTSGFIDLRDETLDLRGPVKPRTGHVGLAAIAGDIKIAGKMRALHASLDPVDTPGAIARGAAAIATAGLSLVGTAHADAAQAKKDDPCERVFN
jgi:AsmA family protein